MTFSRMLNRKCPSVCAITQSYLNPNAGCRPKSFWRFNYPNSCEKEKSRHISALDQFNRLKLEDNKLLTICSPWTWTRQTGQWKFNSWAFVVELTGKPSTRELTYKNTSKITQVMLTTALQSAWTESTVFFLVTSCDKRGNFVWFLCQARITLNIIYALFLLMIFKLLDINQIKCYINPSFTVTMASRSSHIPHTKRERKKNKKGHIWT